LWPLETWRASFKANLYEFQIGDGPSAEHFPPDAVEGQGKRCFVFKWQVGDYEVAVVLSEARKLLARLDARSAHYRIVLRGD
jgi:hypothetical protein